MTDVLTNAQMRAVEAGAFALGRVSGADVMQRAGAGVVAEILATWPDLRASSQRAVVLCGPGNNGGDGYVVARLLRDWGWQVFVHGVAAGGGDAGTMAQAWSAAGGQVLPLTCDALLASMQGAAVVVDALLGIGQNRSADALLGPVLQAKTACAALRWVAVDVPTGLNADSGRMTGALCCAADLTVTFHRAKVGHHLGEGPVVCGQLAVVDLGIASAGIEGLRLTEPAAGLGKGLGHKFSHGHALILSLIHI
jgi:hydroxyethylthiazole kinase-like uncharacterized protein yjeF